MDYNALKRDELARLCEERGVRGRSHKTKPQLIGLLQAYDQEMAELARLRARRRAGRAKKELPPVTQGKGKKAGLVDLPAAEPFSWPANMASALSVDQQAIRIDAELSATARIAAELSATARIAAEQSQMIDADKADATPTPKRPHTIAQTILRHYWQFPLLYTVLNATLRQPEAKKMQFQEGQLFPLTDSKSQTLSLSQMQMQTTLYARID